MLEAGRRFVVVAIGVTLAVASARATVLLPADFGEVVSGSPLIVHGRVVEVRAQAVGDRRTIESVVTLAVLESLRGGPGKTVVFKVPGGQVGRYRRVMVGAPVFLAGDEVVVFLSGRAPAVPIPFGLSQGVYRVTRDPEGRAVVTPPLVMARGVVAERIVRGDPARRPLSIDAFASEVRAAVGLVR